ncbi:peroxiredoxin family protein [Flavobacterium faecale]|uniref:peroxiredoxin family protein n=1 Tax=Flavobacterium faecale TaxID=1355330 RepID=UPI003AABD5D3
MNQNHTYGILGQIAPRWEVSHWINKYGELDNSIKFENYVGRIKVLFFFQNWCQGCHSVGFPSLVRMVTALGDTKDISFFAIQTVFEGQSQNTVEKTAINQTKYNLKIPFGHDSGDASTHFISKTMSAYRTGGTPWFVVIDRKGIVIFNDFHINSQNAIQYLQAL